MFTYEDPFGKIVGDRITRSQSQDREGPSRLSLQVTTDFNLLVGPVPHPYPGGGGGVPLFNSSGLLQSALDGVVFVR